MSMVLNDSTRFEPSPHKRDIVGFSPNFVSLPEIFCPIDKIDHSW